MEIRDLQALRSQHLLWRLLHGQTRDATFFQSLEWLLCYLEHFGAEQTLRVLVVHSGGSPVGIAPFVVRREPTRLGRLRVLTYPLHDWGTRYGVLGPNPTATLLSALRHIEQTPRDWDLIDLRWVDQHGADGQRTPLAMQQAGFSCRRRLWKTTALLQIKGPWSDYLAGRSSKLRENLRRSARRLRELGRVDFVRYRPAGSAVGDDDPRWDLWEQCFQIADRSWQGRADDGTTLSDATVRDFLRDCHVAAVRAGALDLSLLQLNGRPIAFCYNYHFQGAVFGLRTGYDPEYARQGAGSLLWSRTFQDSFERGDRELDLGVESPAAKRPWATEFRPVYHYPHYRPFAPRAQLLRFKHWLSGRGARRSQ